MKRRRNIMDMATRQKWLKGAALVTIGVGLLTAAAAAPALQAPTVMLADILFWPLDGAQTGDHSTTRLMFAIGGGVLTAWGVLLWMLVDQVMAQMPDVARRIILTMAMTWFVVDSSASVLAEAPVNVIANLPFLAMYLLPLRGWQGQRAAAWPGGLSYAQGDQAA
jgi:hypothetical protein